MWKKLTLLMIICLLLGPSTSRSAPPRFGDVQIKGRILPVVNLEIITQGQSLSSTGVQRGVLNFGMANARATIPNLIGREAHHPRFGEAYYQTDIFVRVQMAGISRPAQLTVTEMAEGPLRGMLYEADRNYPLMNTRNLEPIPMSPNFQIAVGQIPPGVTEYQRQLVVRVPSNMPPGNKQSVIRYNLLVSP